MNQQGVLACGYGMAMESQMAFYSTHLGLSQVFFLRSRSAYASEED